MLFRSTAEISRSQVWQWLCHRATLADGRPVTKALVEQTIVTEMQRFEGGKFALAAELFRRISLAPELPEFLTGVAYEYLD